MYLSSHAVFAALRQLSGLHPFFGITFLVCKKSNLPVGHKVPVPINALEDNFLSTYYRPDPTSKHYFSPFKAAGNRRWLSPKYSSAGSQSTRTRGDFARAFLHDKDTDLWGWATNYIDILEQKLYRDRAERIPTLALAVWLFRDRRWPPSTAAEHVVAHFFSEFAIEIEERRRLFSTILLAEESAQLLAAEAFDDNQVSIHFGRPPDKGPAEGGSLRSLALRGIGPSNAIDFQPGERLSIVTGDNGLGKTFLLECAWWALTGTWAERPVYPRLEDEDTVGRPQITFEIAAPNGGIERKTVDFGYADYEWPSPRKRPLLPGLVIYARVDGSFAVWDPARHARDVEPTALLFTRSQVMSGVEGRIEGLVRDWVRWQHSPQQVVFKTFAAVLEALSTPDLPLRPGSPVRLANEPREIPTLEHKYGIVPFTQESAAIRRIATLAYLLVWAWNEHRIAASLTKRLPENRLLLLVDEVEAHLHPKWQRLVLPALLNVVGILGENIQPQIIAATHSPLVLASLETRFSDATDKLFHLELEHNGEVSFDEVPYVAYGRIDRWLTSDLFELKQARSAEAEEAVERARLVMADRIPDLSTVQAISDQLRKTLAVDDDFWPRWLHFAESKGASI
jgi:AAA domain, putative AbiEii toxin, Type IV TA system